VQGPRSPDPLICGATLSPRTLAVPMNDQVAPGRGGRVSEGPRRSVRLAAALLAAALSLVVFEVVLRLVPAAIPPKLLILFEPSLRAKAAVGAFPLQRDFREVARDDGGPPLFVPKPDSPVVSIDRTADGAARSTDELGFCNPRGTYEGRERIDVIALGDSFSWCHAVLPEEAWPARLGEKTGLRVFSLGLGGKGPYEYVQYLLAFGLVKKPRVVVMNVYGGNDLRDAVTYRDWRDATARGERPPSSEPQNIAPGLVASAVGRNSYAINFLVALASRLATRDASDWEKAHVDFRYTLALPSGAVAFNTENRDRDEVLTARRLEEGTTSLAIWDDALSRFSALAREHGFTAVVSYTPPAFAAYRGLANFDDASVAPLMTAFDESQRRFLADRAVSLGFLFHDLTPDLSIAAREAGAALLYDPVHVHLTARGNDVVAGSLARFLADRGLAASANRP
jgi:hypothetical protein